MTPKETVRKFCVICAGGYPNALMAPHDCGGDKCLSTGDENHVCWFFPYREGKKGVKLRIIKTFCKECMGGNAHYREDVDLCPSRDCPVYEFRNGKNPHRTGLGFGARKGAERAIIAKFQAQGHPRIPLPGQGKLSL